LLPTELFRNRVSNLGLVTQNIQWLLLLGISFVVSVFLQTVRGYNAIQTGVIFTAATVGILVSSLGAERFAGRRTQKSLILAGFVITIAGIGLLIGLVVSSDTILAFVPGLLLIGLGVGVMLTPSVNVVQSAFPEDQQGEISGLSRSVSNLGSSLGTAIAGRHHPGIRPGSGEPILRAGDGLPGRDRAHRHGGRAAAPIQPRATAGLTQRPDRANPDGHHWPLGVSEGGGARSYGVSSRVSHLPACRTVRRQEKRPSSRSLLGNGVGPSDRVRPSGGDALSCLRLALPPSMDPAARGSCAFPWVSTSPAHRGPLHRGGSMAVLTVSL
jgi:Major Facilitator Superfamily